MGERQKTFSRAWHLVTCETCGFESKRNTLVPIPERDRICPKCHLRMKAHRIPADHDPQEEADDGG